MNYQNGREIKPGDYVLATDCYGVPVIGKVTATLQTFRPAAESQNVQLRTPDDAYRRDILVKPGDCYPIDEVLEMLEEKLHA